MGLKEHLKFLALSQMACKSRATKPLFVEITSSMCQGFGLARVLPAVACLCTGPTPTLQDLVVPQWLCLDSSFGAVCFCVNMQCWQAAQSLAGSIRLPPPHPALEFARHCSSSQHGGRALRITHSRPDRGLESISSETSRSLAAAYLQTLSSKQFARSCLSGRVENH